MTIEELYQVCDDMANEDIYECSIHGKWNYYTIIDIRERYHNHNIIGFSTIERYIIIGDENNGKG